MFYYQICEKGKDGTERDNFKKWEKPEAFNFNSWLSSF